MCSLIQYMAILRKSTGLRSLILRNIKQEKRDRQTMVSLQEAVLLLCHKGEDARHVVVPEDPSLPAVDVEVNIPTALGPRLCAGRVVTCEPEFVFLVVPPVPVVELFGSVNLRGEDDDFHRANKRGNKNNRKTSAKMRESNKMSAKNARIKQQPT